MPSPITITSNIINIDLPALIYPNDETAATSLANQISSRATSKFLLELAELHFTEGEKQHLTNLATPQSQIEYLYETLSHQIPDLEHQLFEQVLEYKTQIIIKLLIGSQMSTSEETATDLLLHHGNTEGLISQAISKINPNQITTLL